MSRWPKFKRRVWEFFHAGEGWRLARHRGDWLEVLQRQINAFQGELDIAIDAGRMMERERDTAVHNQKLLIADRDKMRARIQHLEDELRRPRRGWRPHSGTFEPASEGSRIEALMDGQQKALPSPDNIVMLSRMDKGRFLQDLLKDA